MIRHQPNSYPSKRSFWIGLILWGIIGVSFLLSWYLSFRAGKTFDYKLLYVYLPLILFVSSIWFGTFYTLAEDHLEIKVGPWFKKKLPYKRITKVERNHSFISAPALSSDRLLLKFNRYDEILISPLDEIEFVSQLKRKNPAIRVDI